MTHYTVYPFDTAMANAAAAYTTRWPTPYKPCSKCSRIAITNTANNNHAPRTTVGGISNNTAPTILPKSQHQTDKSRHMRPCKLMRRTRHHEHQRLNQDHNPQCQPQHNHSAFAVHGFSRRRRSDFALISFKRWLAPESRSSS